MDIKERFYQKLYESREQLDELRKLSDEQKEKLQKRIRDKHDDAWEKTQQIRKEKKSAGSADTKDIDKFRNRLAKIHNKLDESEKDNAIRNFANQGKDTQKTNIEKQFGTKAKNKALKARFKFKQAQDKKLEEERLDEMNKKSMIGKIVRRRKASKKGWDELSKASAAAGKGDMEQGKKHVRNANRLYNLTTGAAKTPKGFPKSTVK